MELAVGECQVDGGDESGDGGCVGKGVGVVGRWWWCRKWVNVRKCGGSGRKSIKSKHKCEEQRRKKTPKKRQKN